MDTQTYTDTHIRAYKTHTHTCTRTYTTRKDAYMHKNTPKFAEKYISAVLIHVACISVSTSSFKIYKLINPLKPL